MFAILGHWDTTTACKGTFLSFVQLIGEVGSLQAFPLHRPLRQCCCSSTRDIIWGHNCPCQNAVPMPATHFCWFWLFEAHSDNGKGRRRGGEGLWISQIQTPKHFSNAMSKGCLLCANSLPGQAEYRSQFELSNLDCISFTLGHPFPWTHFLDRTQPILNN